MDFDGIKFQAKIGIEKGKKKDKARPRCIRDKNVLDGDHHPRQAWISRPVRSEPVAEQWSVVLACAGDPGHQAGVGAVA